LLEASLIDMAELLCFASVGVLLLSPGIRLVVDKRVRYATYFEDTSQLRRTLLVFVDSSGNLLVSRGHAIRPLAVTYLGSAICFVVMVSRGTSNTLFERARDCSSI